MRDAPAGTELPARIGGLPRMHGAVVMSTFPTHPTCTPRTPDCCKPALPTRMIVPVVR
ncbi:hypothetical protein BD414DRAFT_484081 [Trametes punicea]|nr:hypothetical protein BD414DRAFT_484081 [Trametes punicea]